MNLKDKFLNAVLMSLRGFKQELNNPRFFYTDDSMTKILAFDIDTRALRLNIRPQLLISNNEISKSRKGFTALPHKGDYYRTVITEQYDLAGLYQRPEFKTLGYIIKDEETLKSSLVNFRAS